jgi:hypothetical protein
MVTTAAAADVVWPRAVEPAGYYSFSEGSGDSVFDISGNGNYGVLHNASRFDNGDCGKAVRLNGLSSYIAIPPNSKNHPRWAITVECRFLLNNWSDAPLISTLNEGGYRLGFGDGNDLWWTVNGEGTGDISTPLRHEEISLNEWHSAAATFDGTIMKIFLDGKMLSSKPVREGPIHYSYNNHLMVGAEAGTRYTPAPDSRYFRGALDEVRIYTIALSNGDVIEDMMICIPQKGPVPLGLGPAPAIYAPGIPSGSVILAPSQNHTRPLRFDSPSTQAVWSVRVPAGALLRVTLADPPASYQNTWQVDITDGTNRLGQATFGPSQQNVPAEAVIPHGNAEVTIRYLNGSDRFPAHTQVVFTSLEGPAVIPAGTPAPPPINATVVIYSITGVAVIALLIVMVWLHMKRKEEEHTPK